MRFSLKINFTKMIDRLCFFIAIFSMAYSVGKIIANHYDQATYFLCLGGLLIIIDYLNRIVKIFTILFK